MAGRRQAPQKQQEVAASVHLQQTTIHQGPLPSPEVLRQYELLNPGSAERIIAMAEQEIKHRHDLESKQLDSDIVARDRAADIEQFRLAGIFSSDRWGQVLGAIVSLISVSGAIYTAKIGVHWTVPMAFLSLPVLGMVKAIRNGVTKNQTDK